MQRGMEGKEEEESKEQEDVCVEGRKEEREKEMGGRVGGREGEEMNVTLTQLTF